MRTVFFSKLFRLFRIPTISALDSGILIVALITGNGVNFLYNAYLGRRLSLEEFGIISLVGSILSLAQIPLSALSRTLTHRTAYLLGKYQTPNKQIWHYFRRKSYLISGVTVVGWLALIPLLLPFFQIPRALPFILITPLWIINVVSSVDGGFLSGNLRFKLLAGLTLLEVMLQLGFTVLLIELGTRDWIYLAIPMASGVSVLLGWIAIVRTSEDSKPLRPSVAQYFPWKFYMAGLFSKLSSVAFLNLDMILAKHYLPPTQAGQYALLALVGKIIYYGSALLGQFVIPLVSREEGAGRDSRAIIKAVLGLTSLIIMSGIVGVGILGPITVPWLFGEKARAITPYLVGYTVAMACFGVTSILVSYYQSKHRYVYSVVGFVLSLGVLAGIWEWHNSIGDINLIMSVGGILSLGLILLVRFLEKSVLVRCGLAALASYIEPWVAFSQKTNLPSQMGDYTLQEPFYKSRYRSDYQFGRYKSSKGGMAMGKSWQGPIKTLAYWQLKNEVQVAIVLKKATSSLLKSDPGFLISSFIPVVATKETSSQLVVLFEWIPNHKQLSRLSPLSQIKFYTQIFRYLDWLNSILNPELQAQLSRRVGWHLAIMYGFFLMKAMISRSQGIKELLKGCLVFIRSLPSLVTTSAIRFTHRDLHSDNILISKHAVYIIDHAYAVMTVPFYEELVLLACSWNDLVVRVWLLEQLSKKIKTSSDRSLVQGLAVYIATHLLTDSTLESYKIENYLGFLGYWVSQDRTQLEYLGNIVFPNESLAKIKVSIR